VDSKRRDFLKSSGMVIMGGAAGFFTAEQFVRGASPFSLGSNKGGVGPDGAPSSSAAQGSPADDAVAREKQRPTLVTIFLRGGADALNALIPYGDDQYYKFRPSIGITPKGGKGGAGVVKLKGNDYWGFSPGMAGLLPLYEQGVVVPIINVGSPHDTRSHFSAQDYMERGAPGNAKVTNGWLNRYLEASKKPFDAPLRGLSAQALLPRALRGDYPVLAGDNHTEHMELFSDLYAPQNMENMIAREGAGPVSGSRLDQRPSQDTTAKQLTADMTRDIITLSGTNAVSRIAALDKAAATPTEANYPSAGGLGHQLRTIAKVIKANVGLEVAQADYGGWDTHRGQGGGEGHHAQLLKGLSDCLLAFRQDLGSRMDKVMVLVMSEFGRTVHENGSNGTDHGRGGFMLAMGNMLNGGKFFGTHKGLDDLEHGRFQPVHTDYRNVFAESITRLFHFDPFQSNLFPGYKGDGSNFINFAKQLKEA
jgi:uncharacterized protein (DUF1501 family)